MNFTNTDCVREEVQINQILGYGKVREQVEKQVYERVYLQVVRSFHQPMKIKIIQELNK
jgi:hypothetical protein